MILIGKVPTTRCAARKEDAKVGWLASAWGSLRSLNAIRCHELLCRVDHWLDRRKVPPQLREWWDSMPDHVDDAWK